MLLRAGSARHSRPRCNLACASCPVRAQPTANIKPWSSAGLDASTWGAWTDPGVEEQASRRCFCPPSHPGPSPVRAGSIRASSTAAGR
jgi:hypothetical protein